MELLQGKILIVDDEPDIVEFISYNLKSKGYSISTARDGVEAIRKAKEVRPDLILMDVMMPNKDGIQAVKELRQIPDFQDTIREQRSFLRRKNLNYYPCWPQSRGGCS